MAPAEETAPDPDHPDADHRDTDHRDPAACTVLVTGATGFVGRRLVPALLEDGRRVRAMTRRPEAYDGPGEPVGGDVSDPDSLVAPLDGVDVAIYLVHSLDSPDFERRDAEAARAFGAAAAHAGVRQIVYLGGLGSEDEDLSPHLRSRREVEGLLGESGVPVTVLRAAIVVGQGGISWELTRQLVKNLPAMVVPKWVSTRTQPIALDDVTRYLAGVVDDERAFGRVFEIGGPDQLTYLEMLQQASLVSVGKRVPIVQVPVLTPRLSSYWLALVTDVDVTTGRNLIDSMGTEVVVTDTSIREIVPGDPVPYEEAVRRALEERGRDW
ncbi:NAD-dependent epimerase/dehydratase family protein [Nocardioides guangzhouensis]|uniref:NAD-dependent epimerase/dehydratase family protein n=1 Tax=Nocardioides guangzhouensis TaxID=2497878 RepID=A0A4Q4Z664_9ACTN|nr:NAD(P)H-binding protein [Nocardioides guangzhouensis]RYP83193.1 NAD-dependent epimerase/dehydratase family protein [Nocardioides guangzhouensis]